jgi:hypothetical protein
LATTVVSAWLVLSIVVLVFARETHGRMLTEQEI